MKRDLLIACLGDAIIERLYELDDNYTYEADCEFGGFEASCSCYCFTFEWGNGECEAEATVTWPYGKEATLEVILYGGEGKVKNAYKDLSNLEKAVTEYVDENLDTGELLDAMLDDLREAYEDEWQSHGFRDERDYLTWRYG
jgi:hypothetical protein